jgi:hypothetical protein
MQALLDQCIARQIYGDEAATVRHFINVGLERLIDQHRIIDVPSAASSPSTDATPDDEPPPGRS